MLHFIFWFLFVIGVAQISYSVYLVSKERDRNMTWLGFKLVGLDFLSYLLSLCIISYFINHG